MSDDGSAAILAQINKLTAALQGDAITQGGREWIEQDCKPVAQRLVPYDTGATHDSIDGFVTGSTITMEATTPYAADLEYGTSRMGARPYLLPAIQQTLPMLGKRILAVLNRSIK